MRLSFFLLRAAALLCVTTAMLSAQSAPGRSYRYTFTGSISGFQSVNSVYDEAYLRDHFGGQAVSYVFEVDFERGVYTEQNGGITWNYFFADLQGEGVAYTALGGSFAETQLGYDLEYSGWKNSGSINGGREVRIGSDSLFTEDWRVRDWKVGQVLGFSDLTTPTLGTGAVYLSGNVTLSAIELLQTYRYWLVFYGYGRAAVPLTPGPHTALDYTDVYPEIGEAELHVLHQTANQPEDYLSLPLSRDHASALADSRSVLTVDPCYAAPAAEGEFIVRLSFVSDALGGVTTVHTASNTLDGLSPGLYGLQVMAMDYPPLAALLEAYASGAGSYLTLSINNGGASYRDVDFGIYNIRIDSPRLTPVFLADNPLGISSAGAQWNVVLPKSAGYIDYTLERSDDLATWTAVSTKNQIWGPLTWQVPKAGDRDFFRVRVGN